MTEFIVREALEHDRPRWDVLWSGYNAFYGRHGGTALARHVSNTTWSRFFDPREPLHALVAECDGELLGLAHFLFHRSTIQTAPACYLQDLFVVDAARGQGVGRALIGATCDAARTASSNRVYWQTHETNSVAMRLYDCVAERTGIVVYHKVL